MFDTSTYRSRRRQLLQQDRLDAGLVLLLGNERCAVNYADNTYPFRQDSTFLYYFGIDRPSLYGVIDLDEGTSTIYGEEPNLEDIVWTGEQNSLRHVAEAAGVENVAPVSDLENHLSTAQQNGAPIHFLPPYRAEHRLRYESLLDLRPDSLETHASEPLIRAVVQQRSQKTEAEIAQIEAALDITTRLHEQAIRQARPGVSERDIVGSITGMVATEGVSFSFPPTCSIRGEVLHNHEYSNSLEEGDLLLLDAGATSPLHYAGDLTRVTPVGGAFSDRQRALYEAVRAAQTAAIEALEPDVPFREIHLRACRVLTGELIDIGLMRGDAAEAVAAGAHALFFPHGLGHMLGLDAHDMENLGEEYVGYADDQTRDEQFGLHALRLARPLRSGFVLTVEPGCYFIPSLVERWRAEDRHEAFINYDVVEDFLGAGGIRLEDDIRITADGAQILGPTLPKAPNEVEALAGTATT